MYGFSYIRMLITEATLYRVLPYRINHLNHTGILNPIYKVSPGDFPIAARAVAILHQSTNLFYFKSALL